MLMASGADEALRMLDRRRIDILISDIGMPEVDGYRADPERFALRAKGDRPQARRPLL